MRDRNLTVWTEMRRWCRENPDRKGAVVVPDGTFVIMFKPRASESEIKAVKNSFGRVMSESNQDA